MDPCQEDLKKYKDQNQGTSHIPQDAIPPSQEPHSPPSPISYPSTRKDHNIPSTIPNKITKDHEKNTFPMLSKNPCQDQSIPSCSTSSHPIQNYTQALSSPIKVINESINGLGHVSHSKDVDIPIHYPFIS